MSRESQAEFRHMQLLMERDLPLSKNLFRQFQVQTGGKERERKMTLESGVEEKESERKSGTRIRRTSKHHGSYTSLTEDAIDRVLSELEREDVAATKLQMWIKFCSSQLCYLFSH